MLYAITFLLIKDINGTPPMNYTLKELQQIVNILIKEQGEDAHCAAWIYTKEDIHLTDEDGDIDYDNVVEDSEVLERIFDDVGNTDYIDKVIVECVAVSVAKQLMLQQQEKYHNRS